MALLLAAVFPIAALAAPDMVVEQVGRAFAVSTVTITRGSTIHFANDDEFEHQVYIDSASFTFDSDESPPGGNIAVTFPVAGVFVVHCHIHPKMHLQVQVLDHN